MLATLKAQLHQIYDDIDIAIRGTPAWRETEDMLQQAVVLYRIARADIENPPDEQYLATRVRHETANTYGVGFLKENANDPDIS